MLKLSLFAGAVLAASCHSKTATPEPASTTAPATPSLQTSAPNGSAALHVGAEAPAKNPPKAPTPPYEGPCGRTPLRNATFKTDDDITLQADYYPSGKAKSPAIVLLHMIPPNWDRTSYPPRLIEQLVAAGFSVLNLDRRGAGGSGGKAVDAYVGDKGALDVKAAVKFLGVQNCAYDASKLVLVGASNGTTSALDYAVDAQPPLAGLVFMSPGPYTDKQHAFAKVKKQFAATPILFMFPDAEREWPSAFQAAAPAGWKFLRFDGAAHGTKLFEARPISVENLVTFATAAVSQTN